MAESIGGAIRLQEDEDQASTSTLTAYATILDPLQELCPSLEATKALCSKPSSEIPGGEALRRSKIQNAILKAASSGDNDLLLWICSQIQASRLQQNLPAFNGFDWATIRDEDAIGPVNLATSMGHADAVRTLIQAGAEINERDSSGWTPLMFAINNANLPLVSFLLSHGADSEAKTSKGVSCEDFILSAPTPAEGSTAEGEDRQLISDLIFEHQRASHLEREQTSNLQQRLRSLSVRSDGDSIRQSPFQQTPLSEESRSPGKQSFIASSIGGHSRSSSTTMRRLVGHAERTQIAETELRARELGEGRRRALLDVAVMLQVEYQDLLGEQPTLANPTDRQAKKRKGKPVHSGLASGCGAIEVGADPLSNEFDFESVRADQMLVFGEKHVDAILNYIVKQAKPIRAPWTSRSKPANVMYLCLRYASFMADEDLQEELLFGFVNAVEAVLYAKPTELTYLAFWLHNAVLLLHYLQKDATLATIAAGEEYRSILAELVNEIYIFIVRDVERRIDKVLDSAILEHESIPSLDGEEIRYENEWSILKTLKGSVRGFTGSAGSSPAGKKRRPLSQIFAAANTPEAGSPRSAANIPTSSPASVSRDGSMRAKQDNAKMAFSPSSPSKLGSRPTSLAKTSNLGKNSSPSDSSASDLMTKPSPRTITTMLTSVLHVLQLYEINPCIIVQALSQILFWVGCETFNRIMVNKKFICKNKAMQIRLNISGLEDWVKTNALPGTLISHHFAKVNQLVTWILCQSSLTDFDGLIATLQGLKSLNPLQLKHIIGEYRYEIGEHKMKLECVQYLDQLEKDWQRGRIEAARAKVSAEKEIKPTHGRSGTATQSDPDGMHRSESFMQETEACHSPDGMELDGDSTTMDISAEETPEGRAAREIQREIDSLFLTGRTINDYVPRLASISNENSNGDVRTATYELELNSREMLPFALPSQAETLVVSPGDAFGFGRGHFMHTGTPSLKSMRTDSLVPSPCPSPSLRLGSTGAPSSRSSSPLKGVSSAASRSIGKGPGGLGLGIQNGENNDQNDDTLSITASSHLSAASSSSVASSTLFPQGKGFTAGAYWQPVPVLPEGVLESLNKLMQ
ncbi:uncharacterized protein FA14DRAFT_161899 [Meira miltonrushii]|uniref:Dilute domain-containing protein n=1 Tax=Meira miltonrushii TaxID=1280837 RepID=A0A316V627_9BASI|nr:uncharacterized protein FA14DRAFT_161899 [Meira miltonrushii]PWN32478.1 hypothetical protein FA14DRAFT_161899 [Meira miltonrushii]